MLKEGFVLLFTIYNSGHAEVQDPVFVPDKATCVAVFTQLHHVYTDRKTSIKGGCFDMSDPKIQQYLKEELEIKRGK